MVAAPFQLGPKTWAFVPRDKWIHGFVNLYLDNEVADIASNHIGRKFEVTDLENFKKSKPIVVRVHIE